MMRRASSAMKASISRTRMSVAGMVVMMAMMDGVSGY
jgi:hypothetical protein